MPLTGGKTKVVKVTKDLKAYFKKLSSVGSLLGGFAVSIAKIIPYLLGA